MLSCPQCEKPIEIEDKSCSHCGCSFTLDASGKDHEGEMKTKGQEKETASIGEEVFFKWTEKYDIGIGAVDKQHQQIVHLN